MGSGHAARERGRLIGRLLRLARDVLLGLAALAAALAFVLALLTVRVEGTSMAPSLRDGDDLVADKLLVRWEPPRRGDIVVVLEPSGVPAVKRVIGLPGDTVEIDGATVLLEPAGTGAWRRLEEPYVQPGWQWPDSCCDPDGRATTGARPLTLPAGQFFVLGDNRNVSIDSRTFGLVPRDRIVARAMLRYWPLPRWGTLDVEPALLPE
ncbi:MAG TPA: signal peptidase I [Candidatus Dormibacteraeota bacterium]|nr:signal peptidase I [Candidatus Dormibacteraeota bacterium]